jgi:hypothetical protein
MKEACIFVVALTRATGQDIKFFVVSAHREKNVSCSQIYFLINLWKKINQNDEQDLVDIVVAVTTAVWKVWRQDPMCSLHQEGSGYVLADFQVKKVQ